MTLISHAVYVLHSPYPDKTWRGLEKCAGIAAAQGSIAAFHTPEDADAYLRQIDGAEFFVVVPVVMATPAVRRPLDSASDPYVHDDLVQTVKGLISVVEADRGGAEPCVVQARALLRGLGETS